MSLFGFLRMLSISDSCLASWFSINSQKEEMPSRCSKPSIIQTRHKKHPPRLAKTDKLIEEKRSRTPDHRPRRTSKSQSTRELAAAWHDLDSKTEVAALLSIEGAIEYIRNVSDSAGETHILVTGGLHLVGGAIAVVEDEH